jgi:hypothetical protein
MVLLDADSSASCVAWAAAAKKARAPAPRVVQLDEAPGRVVPALASEYDVAILDLPPGGVGRELQEIMH